MEEYLFSTAQVDLVDSGEIEPVEDGLEEQDPVEEIRRQKERGINRIERDLGEVLETKE